MQHPVAVVSVDVVQCYDRMNHVIMALVWYALKGKMGPILVLFTFMQNMRLFQRTGTGFGDSITFLEGGKLSKYLMRLGTGGSRTRFPGYN